MSQLFSGKDNALSIPRNFPLNRDMPLACFQCADTLQFAAKHAKGMSLRYGVIERF